MCLPAPDTYFFMNILSVKAWTTPPLLPAHRVPSVTAMENIESKLLMSCQSPLVLLNFLLTVFGFLQKNIPLELVPIHKLPL
ncbi:hypothetical protein SDC9_197699 [bioreactor metagenome]|uniref:Uncharacterized protein n=1 Tax=bioreactor metagenome TaxID=1076179 RepID=A0A645IS89_9ZZZZ